MKYVLVLLCMVGVAVSSLALREHYRTSGDAPCDINDRWDCGIVNKSPFAILGGVPVAAIGIVGYVLMGALALRSAYRLLLAPVLFGLSFSLYLAHIEKDILGVWCIYCVISLGVISLMTLLTVGMLIAQAMRRSQAAS